MRWRDFGLVLIIAAVPRLIGLGHVSLWLDEILSSLRVALPFRESWEVWESDLVHPPLSELLQWLWFRIIEPEPWRRLLPIALGCWTVGLLAGLASRWFGRRVALSVALIAALSPLHVRYSQELRAYALGLLAILLALAANEQVRQRRTWVSWAVLGLSLALCSWSLYIAAIIVVPIAFDVLQSVAKRPRKLQNIAGFAVALLLSAALFSPWLQVLERATAKTHERDATAWTQDLIGSRLQFLTVGGVEGEPFSAGALLFVLLIACGTVAGLRRRRGRPVVVGALAGTAGIELILRSADQWSSGRYNLIAWPFLVLLAGLGCVAVSGWLTRLWRAFSGREGRWAGGFFALPLTALLLFEAAGLTDYYRRGRPDWMSVARTVAAAAGDDDPNFVANDWTRISLGYYLSLLQDPERAEISARPRVAEAGRPLPTSECSVLVDGGYPKVDALAGYFRDTPAQLRFPRTAVRVAALATAGSDPWACLPPAVEAAASERSSLWRVERVLSPVLEMGGGDQPQLLFGWSYPERALAGGTFRWAAGSWAAIALPATPATGLRLEMRSLLDEQTVTVYRRRRPLASYPLRKARQVVELPLPSDFGTSGRETFTFGFSRTARPRRNPRPLAVAFYRVELLL